MSVGKLRKHFTNEDIKTAIESCDGIDSVGAQILTDQRNMSISRQLFAYWRQQIETTKQNGEPYSGSGVLDKSIRETMVLRTPSPADDEPVVAAISNADNSSILFIPDQHAPYTHPDALPFLADVAAAIRPTRVINLGDEVDGHAMSMHDSDPNLDSAGPELERAKIFLHALARMFPYQEICHSNHGSLIYRRAFKFGIPTQYIKSYREVLFPDGGGDGWSWHDKIFIDLPNGEAVLVQHQSAGDILSNAAHERASIIQGHEHGRFEITYRSSTSALYWAMVSGCLIDPKAMAFAYGKLFPKRPIIGCSAVIDSQPILIPMPMDDTGRYTGRLSGFLKH